MLLTQEYKEYWSLSSKLVFRLIFTYFSLYIFFRFTGSFFETPFKYIGKSILDITYNYHVNGEGSGDNTYAYITLFMNAILTVFIVVFWTFMDRKRNSYNTLLYWFLALLRIILILSMFLYGSVKIFQLQFPQPSLIRLLEPLGNFSPMGLAWTYMGYSEGFNMFTGFMEVLGALLLIPRRTQTLGAFIIMGVMTHVAMMNFMFDIPVKLLSSHLLAMATVIFMTDSQRFVNVFFKNRGTTVLNYYHPVKDKTYHKAIFWIKTIVLSIIIIGVGIYGHEAEQKQGPNREKPFLYGIWETSHFIKNGDTIAPLITDRNRWKYIIVEYKDKVTVKAMNDKKYHYDFVVDSTSQQIKLYRGLSEYDDFNFTYEHSNPDDLKLKGIFLRDTLKIILKRKDLNDFNLKSRGFRWINETPYNK
ncbi:DoxX family protein [uncultured Psychroserpens sp.]|uniref:DoxX family protein n=1 Tax=uncultured Psychroserpens sp. TaxID=255436 RepID=UPI002619EDBE|nr:DoxX family protein [uncultured Psychroserpens sp.]